MLFRCVVHLMTPRDWSVMPVRRSRHWRKRWGYSRLRTLRPSLRDAARPRRQGSGMCVNARSLLGREPRRFINHQFYHFRHDRRVGGRNALARHKRLASKSSEKADTSHGIKNRPIMVFSVPT